MLTVGLMKSELRDFHWTKNTRDFVKNSRRGQHTHRLLFEILLSLSRRVKKLFGMMIICIGNHSYGNGKVENATFLRKFQRSLRLSGTFLFKQPYFEYTVNKCLLHNVHHLCRRCKFVYAP